MVVGNAWGQDFFLHNSQTLDVTSFYEVGATYDYSTANVENGGSITSVLATYNYSSVTISGGTVAELNPWDSSSAAISGGTVGFVDDYSTGNLIVSGGSIGILIGRSGSNVIFSGGSITELDSGGQLTIQPTANLVIPSTTTTYLWGGGCVIDTQSYAVTFNGTISGTIGLRGYPQSDIAVKRCRE